MILQDPNYYEKIISGVFTSSNVGYSIDGALTTSKLHAIETAKYDMSVIKYHWMENIFDDVQWTVEPEESINTMVDRHVKHIEHCYDHIGLWFSGGYDSFTILKAFLRNNVKIDELLLYQREWHVGEHHLDFQTALDSAIYVKNNWMPNVKITVVNWGNKDAVIQFYKKRKLDWIYTNGNLSRISQNGRAFLYTQNDAVRKTLERPGRSIQINGNDKPRVNLRDGRWYSTKTDTMFFQESNDWSLQFWFLPDLYVKQTWMMIRWLETLEQTSHEFVHQLQSHNIGDDLYMKWNLAIGRDLPLFPFCLGLGIKHAFNPGVHSEEAKPLLDVIQLSDPEIYHIYKLGADHITQVNKKLQGSGQSIVAMSKEYFVKGFKSALK
jgi:hypothetical protein